MHHLQVSMYVTSYHQSATLTSIPTDIFYDTLMQYCADLPTFENNTLRRSQPLFIANRKLMIEWLKCEAIARGVQGHVTHSEIC